jgi:hypothetical protein
MELIEPSFAYDLDGYRYIGRGPSKTGWKRSPALAYRCVQCGGVMPADHADYFDCACGAMSLDYGYGRFGSRFGDQNILVYEKMEPDQTR